jgi:NADH:ubiquinone oxidoreductase subunit K
MLILTLELMYLFLNINFIMSWVLLQYFNGLIYVLLIIGIAGAETIVGLIIVVKLYNTQTESFHNLKTK